MVNTACASATDAATLSAPVVSVAVPRSIPNWFLPLPLGGEHLTLDGARVKQVRVVEHGWGAAQGLVGGVAIGSSLFGVLVAATDNGDSIIFSEEQKVIFGVVAFGLIGGLVDAIVSGNVGRQTVYVFDDAH